MTSDTSARLIRMYRADFANRSELFLRLGATILGAVGFFFQTGYWILLAWLATYLIQQWVFFRVIDPRRRGNTAGRLRLARFVYAGGVTIFLSLPIYMVAQPDPMLFTPAALVLVATAFYVLHREYPTRDVIWIDTSGYGVLSLVLLWMTATGGGPPLFQALTAGLILLTLLIFFRAQKVEQERQAARRLAERRYAQAQKARALNQFVGGVAHDFNNQITAIMGNLELYELLEDPEERSAAMRQCRIAADRAALTVQQLVASSGRTRLQPVNLDMKSFLTGLQPVLKDLLEDDITLSIAPSGDGLQAVVDPDMLETCLIQLCLNAQDAMNGKGPIEIASKRVTTRPTGLVQSLEAQPPYLAISVRDTGPGVAEETLSKLSEPFYTTKGVGAGTGLGLSAVAGFAHQSGGTLLIDNAMPSGLIVTLLLPLSKDTE